MEIKTLSKANQIQKRLTELKTMRMWLEDERKSTYLVDPITKFDVAVSLSSNMKLALLKICTDEITRLEEEFEKL